jgi:hypothetical protein
MNSSLAHLTPTPLDEKLPQIAVEFNAISMKDVADSYIARDLLRFVVCDCILLLLQ